MMNVKDFSEFLRRERVRCIYLSHYEDDGPARNLGHALKKHGFKLIVASDARKFGKDFVSNKIGECDLVVVVDPESSESDLILRFGGRIFDVRI